MHKIKKILMLSDDIRIPSGVGVQSRYIASGLVKKGYEIVQVGGAIKHQDYNIATVDGVKIYPVDGYGSPGLIRNLIVQEQPDAILLFTDPRFWIWLWDIEDEIRPMIPILYYHLWDDQPWPKYNRSYYESCDWIGAISKLSLKLVTEVTENKFNLENWNLDYIPHGHPQNIFKPLDEKDPEYIEFKKEYLGKNYDKYKFIVLYNNRNIRRKMVGDVLYGYCEFVKGLPKEEREKCLLIMHTHAVDKDGTDLRAIKRDLFPESDIQIKFSEKKVNQTMLNMIYNLADVTINAASNEGYGIATAESLMAGTPIIATVTGGLQDQLGTPELASDLWRDSYYEGGVDLKSGDWAYALWPHTRSLTGSPLTPYIFDDRIDWKDIIKGFKYWKNMTRKERKEFGLKGREFLIKNNHTIDGMVNSFVAAFDNVEKNWTPRHRVVIEEV